MNGIEILGIAFIAIGVLGLLADIDWQLHKAGRRNKSLIMRSLVG
jgi:hypothetical protein